MGFEPLPSGVKGEVEQDGRVVPGMWLVGVDEVDTSRMSLEQAVVELRRASPRRLRFRDAPVSPTLQRAMDEHRAKLEFNIYARASLRTQFFRTWKRAFYVFEVPHALSLYRNRTEHEDRVRTQRELDSSNIKGVVMLNGGECRVGELGLRTYRVGGRQLQLYKFKVSVCSGGVRGTSWSTAMKLGHPEERVARALHQRMLDGGAVLALASAGPRTGPPGGSPASFGDDAGGSRDSGGDRASGGRFGAGDGGASSNSSVPSMDAEPEAHIAHKYAAWGTIDPEGETGGGS
eukprot:g4315.t1